MRISAEMRVDDELFRTRWPRLYLDTSVLNDIGRQRLDLKLVARLFAATKHHAVVLVISAAHVRDALSPKDRTRRLASTIERFWMRGLVMRDPNEIEPWTQRGADIDIAPWGNVRELLSAHSARRDVGVGRDAAFVADIAMKALVRSHAEQPRQRLSTTHEAIVACSTYRLALGLDATADDAIDWCACTLTDVDRHILLARLLPVEIAMAALSPYVAALNPETHARFSDLMNAGPDNAPGTWLARQLAGSRTLDLTRDVERRDNADVEHCAYFPYVDIATCDPQVYPDIAEHLATARGPRAPRLFLNRDLKDVVDYVESLPTSEFIRDAAIQRRRPEL
jgi:hypothetical protein